MMVQVAFNAAALAGSVFVASTALARLSGYPYHAVYLAMAAAIYFILNTASVSAVLSLIGGELFMKIWANCHLWSFPYYLLGAGLATLISAATHTAGWRPALLPLPLMYLAYTYYRMFLSQRRQSNALAL
jgi:hypothetical protein